MSYLDIAAQWNLLTIAFHTVLGIDLEDVFRVKSWRWYKLRVSYLLSRRDNPLGAYFAPDDDPKPEAPE